MKHYIAFGLPVFSLVLVAVLGVGAGMTAAPRSAVIKAEPVKHASLSEEEMQRIAVMLNEIEPQAN